MSSLILNLPYSSCAIPPGVARALGLSEEELRLEHWRLCDPHLARLAKSAAQLRDQDRPVVTYDYSPIVADPLGLWALELGGGEGGAATLPRSTAGKTIAWKEKDREVIFNRAVVPYYQRLQECVEAALKHSPLVLVLTVRSYSSRPLEFEKNRRYPRPQATVSSEEGLTPQGLADLALRSLRAFHWWAGPSGRPEGAAWLPPMLRGRPRVKALGLSLCRRLYMDEQTGRSAESLPGARRVLGTLFNLLEQEVDRVGRLRLDRARGSGKIPSPVIKAASL